MDTLGLSGCLYFVYDAIALNSQLPPLPTANVSYFRGAKRIQQAQVGEQLNALSAAKCLIAAIVRRRLSIFCEVGAFFIRGRQNL